ncbi:MAG: methyltransferase domain-containing protein [Phycisphaerae bacterium]
MNAARIKTFLSDPELLKFFFLLRFYRVITRLTGGSVRLSTRGMMREGIERVIEKGRAYYLYDGSRYPEEVARGNAMDHIGDHALTFCKGKGLDIGANKWPLPGAHPVENRETENAYRLDRWADGALDFVFSSHCLEHLAQWRTALALWVSKLKPGGVLFLYLPHHSMTLWRPGSPWVGDDHVWSPSAEVLVPFLEALGMTMIEVDPGPDDYFSFHIVARRGE